MEGRRVRVSNLRRSPKSRETGAWPCVSTGMPSGNMLPVQLAKHMCHLSVHMWQVYLLQKGTLPVCDWKAHRYERHMYALPASMGDHKQRGRCKAHQAMFSSIVTVPYVYMWHSLLTESMPKLQACKLLDLGGWLRNRCFSGKGVRCRLEVASTTT